MIEKNSNYPWTVTKVTVSRESGRFEYEQKKWLAKFNE